MATRSKSSARAAKPAATAKPPKAGNAAAQPVPPVADEAMSSVAVWDTYQAALQAQRSGDLEAARAGYLKVLQSQPQDFDVLHMLGVLETQQKHYPEALRLLQQALQIDPGNPTVHNNLGVALCGMGRHEEGLVALRRALALDAEFADACCNIGRALCDTGRHAESLVYFDRAVALEPEIADIHFQRAAALDRLQRRDEALAAYERVVELNPGHAEAHCKRGHLLSHAKRFRDALVSYDRAIAANPQYAEAHCNRANALRLLGHLPEALVSVDRAIALPPEVAPAHRIRGVVLMGLARYDDALKSLDRALELQPAYGEALNDRGNTLRMLGRYDEALRTQEQAIRLNPVASGAYANRAVALMDIGRPEDALPDMNRALELSPENAEFWNLKGNALQALNRHAEALSAYSKALELQPGYAQPEFNISMCTLVRGEFVRGWPLYEARWRTGQKLGWIRFRKPQWRGEPASGRLLLWGEQGIGDQILHLGMLDSLRQRAKGMDVVLAVAPRLLPLVQRSFPGLACVPLARATREPCDLQIPLGSIGGLVRRSWAEFPRDRKAYLLADTARVEALRSRLLAGDAGGGRADRAPLVVGLSWMSRAERFGELKSIALKELQPLLELPGLRFVDLQYGDTRGEREALRKAQGIEVQRLPDIDTFNDMDGLAALIGACDLVVTTSNTTAHLAGALGAPTLLMLPFASGRHWYWHEAREDNPWYPSMQLFRQQAVGEWGDIVARVRDAVLARMKAPH
jgi:tetratricopeptide (TPR) repeat protein